MLTLHITKRELYNETDCSFIEIPEAELHLEHSLVSLSRWESKWKKPFLKEEQHTKEETIDYIRCMCMDKNVNPIIFDNLSMPEVIQVEDYIKDPHTATTIYDRRPNRVSRNSVLTSEVIYYQMIYFGIPFECQKWHLNRLITLLRVCSIKGGTTQQQMDLNSIFAQNNKLNNARRAAMNNHG